MHFYRDLVQGETPQTGMSAIKQDILWSPHLQNRFITFGTDLKLYSFANDEVTGNSVASTSSGLKSATLIALNTDNQYLKCVCWYPKETYDDLLAVGLANGRVVITSFNLPNNPCQHSGKEFIPRHARHCNTLSWNPEDINLLAAGLDKHRNDHSLLVWDIVKSSPFTGDPERRSLPGSSDNVALATRPIAELAYAEIVHSVQWFSHSPKTLIAGINHRSLKIYDVRESTNAQSTASTKAVYGVCSDPFFTFRVASYAENQVLLWDTRNFEKPIATLYDSKPIVKIAWCPTRGNLLATLSKDALTLKLYALQHTSAGTNEMEHTIVERSLQPVCHQPLQSFCWHPKDENRIVATSNFNEFHNHIVSERITLNWSPTSTLVWSDGKQLQYIDPNDAIYASFDDISVKIRQRAEAGYGLEMQHLRKNGEFVKEDKQLVNLWNWLDLVKGMRDEIKLRPTSRGYTGCIGIHSVICGDTPGSVGTKLKSDFSLRSWVDVPTFAHIPAFKSADRDRALQLCGWTFDSDGVISDSFLDRLQSSGHNNRAAAIAVFNQKILKAMEILNIDAQKNSQVEGAPLSLVAMALSGYVGDRNSLWRDTCDRMRSNLKDPYLTAMFAFLTCENDSYEEVLNDKSGLTVQDRVAFACIFLPDIKLTDLLERLKQQLMESGNLDGMLLTGLSKQGVDLLQNYIDFTGDIQTASYIVLQALLCGFEMDDRITHWIRCYREKLDQWRLWQERARFDVHWRKVDNKFEPPKQVYLGCNFCGKPVNIIKDPAPKVINYVRINCPPNKSKFSSCPGCRKPLPRCALCLVHMGTPSGTLAGTKDDNTDQVKNLQKLSTFDSWFTWCQTCRHGGHANHIALWFKNHVECPVTGCDCKCMAVDAFNPKDLENFLPSKPS